MCLLWWFLVNFPETQVIPVVDGYYLAQHILLVMADELCNVM